jgi:hypothetical protein
MLNCEEAIAACALGRGAEFRLERGLATSNTAFKVFITLGFVLGLVGLVRLFSGLNRRRPVNVWT